LDAQSADEESRDCGYEPELKRTLGSFQVFAISFAFISVAVGIFGTYDDVLRDAGPVGIWLWVIVAIGQTLVALVVAQFAARIALSGSSYQWASRLANPKIGWLFGWLTFWYLAIAVVAMDNALASQALMPLAGVAPNENTARLITLRVLLIQAVLVIASTRLLGMITSSAVGIELAIVVVLVIGLGAVMLFTGSGTLDNLTSRGITAGTPNYFAVGGGLMAGMIMGLTTLVGFDSAANLAEEAKDPFRSVPRAIVSSVVAAGVLGLLFVVTLTVAIKDIARVSTGGSPVASIIRDQLGPVMERILLSAIVFAMFGAGMVVMAACSRQVFAMARDSRFPAHNLMRRVNPRTQTPVPATILILVGSRPHGRTAGRRAAAVDHRVDDPSRPHLRRDRRALPRGAKTPRTQGGWVQPRALRTAGSGRRAHLGCIRIVRAGVTRRSLRSRPDRRRPDPRGRALLRQDADLQPGDPGNGTGSRRCFLTPRPA
jgi:amino acid transporter